MVTQVRCRRLGGLPEEDFAKIRLEQELFDDAQRLEETLDVAIGQRPLLGTRGGVRPVLQTCFVDDDVSRVLGPRAGLRLRSAEERQQHAVGAKHANELIGQRLRGFLVQVVEHVPAEDAVDAARTPAGTASSGTPETDRGGRRERDDRCPSTDLRR